MSDRFRILFSFVVIAVRLSTASVSAASISTVPIADAFVATGPTGNLSNNNYGGGGALGLAAPGLTNGEFQAVIKFDLSGVTSSLNAQFGMGQWSVQSVSLQLTSSPHNNVIYNDIVSGLFAVSLMQNTSWVEGSGNASNPATNGITYNTLQSTFISNAADQALGVLSFPGGSSGANLYSLTLSSGLDADILSGGLVSLRLYAADNQVSYLFSSRAMPALSQPQLIVTAVPEPASLALAGLFSIWLHRFCRRTIGLPATKPNPQAPSARVAGSGTATRVSSGRGEAVPKLRESEG